MDWLAFGSITGGVLMGLGTISRSICDSMKVWKHGPELHNTALQILKQAAKGGK